MDYSFNSRVRYSETGEDGRLTLPGVLNYFQDCSTFHAESIGLGGNVLKNRDRAWVLSSWQVVVEEYPVLGTEIRIRTAECHQVKSHQCLRQHSSRLKPQSQNQHDPGTASMKKHLCRKQPIRWYIKNEAGKKGADGCRQQDPSAASFSQKQFANNAKKNIIHKKIRQKDDVYVYVIIHKKAPCGRQSFTLVSEPIIRSQGAQILSKRDGKS